MRILVLGRTGQVGWELQRALAPLGELVSCGRSSADLTEPASIARTIAEHEPDILVNAAAYTQVDRAEDDADAAMRINTAAVGEMAEAMAARGGWFVHYSTDYVFDGAKADAYKESDATAPLGVYGATKLAGEAAVMAAGGQHLIFRTSWVYAARGQNFVRTMLRLARERNSLRVVADQTGSPTSAELIADVTALALKRISDRGPDEGPIGGLYHLTAAGETTWHGLASRVVAQAEQAGATLSCRTADIEPIGTSDYPTPAKRPVNSRLDTTKLRETFRVNLPDWRHHVDRTVLELVER
ncbi:dTDP-4-dehydrorhamnose reductase [Algihabitans albus]|uniref:dTDP-4-dehydrorhamnose reductase n=1 Tax=Algihabitans albus TaxID=2164067 RepID=UPI000E5CF120|nr:dTDP-4-dehydrorhamnose reductase [Algihabitans albus]